MCKCARRKCALCTRSVRAARVCRVCRVCHARSVQCALRRRARRTSWSAWPCRKPAVEAGVEDHDVGAAIERTSERCVWVYSWRDGERGVDGDLGSSGGGTARAAARLSPAAAAPAWRRAKRH
eukprot:2986067-Prymnesium_polylepis.1